MQEISSSQWQRRGSSIVFDQQALGPLVNGGALVSLRQALQWLQNWPENPPSSPAVLVCGLEPCLELFNISEAEAFLQARVQKLVEVAQYRWQSCGLVFGFTKPGQAFTVNSVDEELLYVRQDRQQVRLARALWGGSAVRDVVRLNRSSSQKVETIGYYVQRTS